MNPVIAGIARMAVASVVRQVSRGPTALSPQPEPPDSVTQAGRGVSCGIDDDWCGTPPKPASWSTVGIGTWLTPELPNQLAIDTVPLPE